VSLTAILFGTLIIPKGLFESVFAPLFFTVNLLAGILLISKKKIPRNIFIGLLVFTILTYLISALFEQESENLTYVRFSILFLFYCMVTLEIIAQVWHSEYVNRNVILGLISGYICLGLIGFFICNSIELIDPGSFKGLASQELNPEEHREGLVYYSYITLLTIGYGDIVPTSKLARNAAMLIGLLGQFYMVIITAIVVGKFISQRNRDQRGD
jgi:hypothetical protein